MRNSCTGEYLHAYHDITFPLVLTLMPSECYSLERFEHTAKELNQRLRNATSQGLEPLLSIEVDVYVVLIFLDLL